jgi:1-acyl-sn-glycerol-3-phosphate acyltransferase
MALLWSLLIIDPLIILSTIACGSVSVIASLFDSTGRAAMRVARFWSRSLLLFARVRVKVEGLENIDPGASYVFCSNHLSYMDTPVVLSSIPAEFRFLAKEGLSDAKDKEWINRTTDDREDQRGHHRTANLREKFFHRIKPI